MGRLVCMYIWIDGWMDGWKIDKIVKMDKTLDNTIKVVKVI